MKTFRFFLAMFCISSLCNSQVTLEYTDYTYGPQDKSYFFNTENTSYHYVIANDKTNLTIKTETQTIYKVVTFPTGVYKDTMMFTDKLFNQDSQIEFIYLSKDIGYSEWYAPTRMRLMNENGEVLQDFGYCDYAAIIKNHAGEYKFITLQTGAKNVYSLFGTLSTDQQGLLNKNLLAFPNPTESTINISNPLQSDENASFKIYSLEGKEVKNVNVNGESEFVNINVEDLPSGTYIINIKGYSKKFIKK